MAKSKGKQKGMGLATRGGGVAAYKSGGITGGLKPHGHYAKMMPKTAKPQGAAAGGYPVPDEGEMGGAAGEVQKGTIEPQPSRGFKKGGVVKRYAKGGVISGKTGKMESKGVEKGSLGKEFETAEKKNTLFRKGGKVEKNDRDADDGYKSGGLTAKRSASGINRRGDAFKSGGSVGSGATRLHYRLALGEKMKTGGISGKSGGKTSVERGSGGIPKGDLRPKKGGAK